MIGAHWGEVEMPDSAMPSVQPGKAESPLSAADPRMLLDIHLAEYQALTNRITYWISISVSLLFRRGYPIYADCYLLGEPQNRQCGYLLGRPSGCLAP
jgi:hypothetical protein